MCRGFLQLDKGLEQNGVIQAGLDDEDVDQQYQVAAELSLALDQAVADRYQHREVRKPHILKPTRVF